MVGFGQNVKARDNVARCDDTLHIEVRFNGKEVNAEEFINMMRDNVVMESQLEMQGKNPEIATLMFILPMMTKGMRLTNSRIVLLAVISMPSSVEATRFLTVQSRD